MLLNDDIEIVSDDFVVQLVAPLFEEGIGMTGARLLFPDGRIQSAGLAIDQRLEHLMRRGRRGPPRPVPRRRDGRASGSAAPP